MLPRDLECRELSGRLEMGERGGDRDGERGGEFLGVLGGAAWGSTGSCSCPALMLGIRMKSAAAPGDSRAESSLCSKAGRGVLALIWLRSTRLLLVSGRVVSTLLL
mmetsp:Transcript_46600/g.113476  ORF Transcript_46600/g.113476 Transcript_46600/m.113476 type:complete len:106 (+) Transcript_46600:463-780(+)